MPEQDVGSRIKALLSRLKERPDAEVNYAVYEGRAVSRSGDRLHLAVSDGVLSIPTRNIQNVTPLTEEESDILRVEVRGADEVRQLVKVRPPLPGEHDPTPGISIRPSHVSLARRACFCGDTATITAGRPDATDDFIIIVAGW